MAYALHLRHRLEGRLDTAALEAAKALAERLFSGHTGEPLAWLLPVLAELPDFESLALRFEGRMLSDGDGAHCASAFRDGGRALLDAGHRADGVASRRSGG